jgi:hypothetical protein
MKKSLFFTICISLVFAFSGTALAGFTGWPSTEDDTGDTPWVAGYGIGEYGLGVYDTGTSEGRYMELRIDLEDKVPGFILLDIDADGDTATGGTAGILNVFPWCSDSVIAPVKGTPVKPQGPGLDMMVNIYLRKQDAGASSAHCSDCDGPAGVCVYNTQDNTGCTGTVDCYKIGAGCNATVPPTANCYNMLTPCTGDTCYEMIDECTAHSDECDSPRLQGEWYVSDNMDPTKLSRNSIATGRIDMPLPPATGSSPTLDLSILLPLDRILDQLDASPWANFDRSAANNVNNIKYQVTTFYNELFNDDFMDQNVYYTAPTSLGCMPAADTAPNTDYALSTAVDIQTHAQKCKAETSDDAMVTGPEIGILGFGFGETKCMNYRP